MRDQTIRHAWTEDEDQFLRDHYGGKMSVTDFAAKIGVSRNAVIGRAQRLGLSAAHKTGGRVRRAKARLTRSGMAQAIKIAAPRPKAVRPPSPLQERAFKPLPVCVEPVSFIELQPHHCRWPVNREGEPHSYCGSHKEPGSSYCRHHVEASMPPMEFRRARKLRRARAG